MTSDITRPKYCGSVLAIMIDWLTSITPERPAPINPAIARNAP